MADNKTPEVWLELSQGQFKLLADGITFHIVVNSRGPAPPGSESHEERDAWPAAETVNDYYRAISKEMYEEIGRLAKNLNVSIQDLSLWDILQTRVGSPGASLDQAQDQLTDVIQMTEEATLNILELIEKIQDDCRQVQTALQTLNEAEGGAAAATAVGSTAAINQLVTFYQTARRLLPALAADGETLQAELVGVFQPAELASESPRSAPPTEAEGSAPAYQFSLATILQTLYEFCTNETVKQHLKAFLAQREAMFHEPPVNAALNRLSQTMTPEDNFFHFPVEQLIPVLADACRMEQGRALLKKMAATTSKIFLDTVLPLEVPPVVEDSDTLTRAEEDTAASPPSAELASRLAAYLKQVCRFAGQLPELSLDTEKLGESSSDQHPAAIRERLAQVVPPAQERLQHINGSLSRILESLAFQDLSGQRILKVLKTLRELQMHLLTMLVAFGTKIKKKEEKQELTVSESNILAQDEIDRLLSALTTRSEELQPEQAPLLPRDSQPLDQDSVNELMASLGF